MSSKEEVAAQPRAEQVVEEAAAKSNMEQVGWVVFWGIILSGLLLPIHDTLQAPDQSQRKRNTAISISALAFLFLVTPFLILNHNPAKFVYPKVGAGLVAAAAAILVGLLSANINYNYQDDVSGNFRSTTIVISVPIPTVFQ